MNSLKQLRDCGQSIWLDYIRRDLLTSGEFQRLVEEDGVHGVTSNPTIFDKAIAAGSSYDDALRLLLAADPDLDALTLFENLEIEDLQMAADTLRPVYDQTEGTDGFVSIEVSPRLAYGTAATIAEAQRLWKAVNRSNLMAVQVDEVRSGSGYYSQNDLRLHFGLDQATVVDLVEIR